MTRGDIVKLVNILSGYVSFHHKDDPRVPAWYIRAVDIMWRQIVPPFGDAGTALAGLKTDCILVNLQLMEQRGWRNYLLVGYEEAVHQGLVTS